MQRERLKNWFQKEYNRSIRFFKGSNKLGKVLTYLKQPVDRIRRKKLTVCVEMADLCYGLRDSNHEGKEIIVSMTSYPERFDSVYYALKSIILQDYKPDRIIMWYDCDENLITSKMKTLTQYGVEYIHVQDNLKPHNKYYWAMERYPDSIIITVDDDLIYPKDMIESLLNCYEKNPTCVCARRVHRMRVKNGVIQSYALWGTEYRCLNKPSHLLCATGAGGVLYPPHCLHKKAFDINAIKDNCFNADDIWLKYMELLNQTKVVWAKNSMVRPPIIMNSQITSLSDENVLRGRNDICINKMNELYGQEITKVLN